MFAETDVLVVGGGPSGTRGGVAAARLGADVMLLERYNHLGGLSTGGLVIWIDRMTDWEGKQRDPRLRARSCSTACRSDAVAGPPRGGLGLARRRARPRYWSQRTAAFHGVVTWSPTIDPERLKLAIAGDGARAQGAARLPRLGRRAAGARTARCAGVIFESKAGRLAILAKVVVDATGDGDIFARAGAAFDTDIEEADVHHCMNTAWLFGGVDMDRWIDFKSRPARAVRAVHGSAAAKRLGFFEQPFVSWRNDIALFMGPRQSGLLGARRRRPDRRSRSARTG